MGYSAKVYRKDGGDTMVVADGGKIVVETGGTIESGGDAFTAVEFDTDHFAITEGTVTPAAGLAFVEVQTALADLAGSLTGSTDGTLADVAAIALDTSNTYTDSAVNTAVNTAITSVNLQLKELQAKFNALLAKLRAAGVIAES